MAKKNSRSTPVTSPEPANTQAGFLDQLEQRIAPIPAWLRTAFCMLLVLACGFAMYFSGRTEPIHLFWDENYHVTSAQNYVEGISHMEPHPPLGLLLIAAGEALTGANQGLDKSALLKDKSIGGDDLPAGFSFAGMRLMPSLFAALGSILFFGLMLALTENRFHALLLSSLYLFENAWAVHFRAVHLDSFQMFFSLGALWLFVHLWKNAENLRWQHYAGLAALCSLASMVKINAALLFILFPILYFKDTGTWKCKNLLAQARHFALKAGASTLVLIITVFSIFALHAAVAHRPPSADLPGGQKDLAFMSPAFKDYVYQNQTLTPSTVLSITSDYFAFMQNDHKGVPKLDVCKPGENGSHPLMWPLMHKTINYRWDSADGLTRYVQLVGNQVSWVLGLGAVLLSILTVIQRRIYKLPVSNTRDYALLEVFTSLYLIFMLLHLYLNTQRVMYLYHYFLGLLISYILLTLNWQIFADMHNLSKKIRNLILAVTALTIVASGLFFMPLSHYHPMSTAQCKMRNIFTEVVDCQ